MHATRLLLVLLAISAPPAPALHAQDSPAEALLAGAITWHDPEGAWTSGSFRLELAESRPDGTVRETTLGIDNRRGLFELATRRDGALIEGRLDPGECELRLDGSSQLSDQQRARHRLTCERLAWLRDYYVYLWGLPMKLTDPGTRLDPEIIETTFQDRPVRALRVTYDPEVGSDVWYFYFAVDSPALVGYRFYHDEAAGDGEYIVLDGELASAGLRLPRERAWYTNAEDRHLGTDSLVSLTRTGQ